ncbi:YceI family protein [Limimonas halophila]|nr:YceI family protein [Limimonas halophila]
MKRLTAAALLFAAPPAHAADAPSWDVDPEASRVGFVAEQSGSPVPGEFTAFDASIAFDRDAPDAGRVDVEIEIASVDAGSAERDDTITSEQLFHAEKHPTARFVADDFTHKDGKRYVAHGELTMRGQTHPVDLPFTLAVTRRDATLKAVAEGTVTVKRLRWGIGQGVWRNTGMVPNEVDIEIRIVATRPAGD